jgi:integrase
MEDVMKQRVKLFTRPTVNGKRQWIEVNPKTKYAVDETFYLRWLPFGATNYSYESLGNKWGLKVYLKERAAKELRLLEEPEPEPKPEKAAQPKTLEEFRTDFLHDKKTTVRSDGTPLDADTVRTYTQVTREFLDTIKRNLPTEITRQNLKDWLAHLRERLDHSSICNYYRHVVCFLHACGVDHKKLLSRDERPKPSEPTPEAYTPEEMTQFFFTIVDEREALAFEFLLKTGAREKEMTHLIWPDLNLGITPTVKFRITDGFRTKTRKMRTVPLEKSLATKLAAWHEKNPTMPLVFGKNGKVCNTYLRVCKGIAKRAGMEPSKFKLHKFRDTFATWALRRGVDIRTVQHWLGHANITMTQKYLAPEQGEAAQNQINRAFGETAVDSAAARA